ncbi:MAG: DUF3987 domain-containing protein [Chloroflexota bacterium]|nr:DUF3987 domain-containing protein [Chloroflexota bacterium]
MLASAISEDVIAETGYYSVSNPRALPPIFTEPQRELAGMVIPIRDVTGTEVNAQLKPDTPRVDIDGRTIKYEMAINGRPCIDVPPRSLRYLHDIEAPLWFTEGRKKADSGLSHGIGCIVSLSGVYGWMRDRKALPDFLQIELKGREIIIAFDSDVMRKEMARDALVRFGAYLQMLGAHVRYCLMPDLPDGSKCGIDDHFFHSGTLDELMGMLVDALPGEELEWDTPIPLDPTHGPPLPIHQIPGVLGTWAAALAHETQTAIDLPAMVSIGTVSAAAGGKYAVSIPEYGWIEPVHTYMVTAQESANRKTAVFSKCTGPVEDYEDRQAREDEARHAAWESRLRVLEKQRTSAENSEANPDRSKSTTLGTKSLDREACMLELIAHLAQEPSITQVIVDDSTTEAAKSVLAAQGGAAAVMSAESAFISVIAGRYSQTADLDLWTKGHGGDSMTINRIGRRKEKIKHTALTVNLAIQPHVLASLGSIDGFIEVGGAARILPSIPADILGTRLTDNIQPVPESLCEAWDGLISRILERRPFIENKSYVPWKLYLSPEALALFRPYRARHESNMAASSPFRDIRDWYGKLPGAVLRLAGLFHICLHEEPEGVEISADTLSRALHLATYFTEHARVMYAMMASSSSQSMAGIVLSALLSGDRTTTKRKVHRSLQRRRGFDRANALDAPLALLEDRGWIRRERVGKSDVIHMNPLAFGSSPSGTPPNVVDDVDDPGISSPVRTPEPRTHVDDVDNSVPFRGRNVVDLPAPLAPTGTEDYLDEI